MGNNLRRLQAMGRMDLVDQFNKALQMVEEGSDPRCMDCNDVLETEGEKEEGRCSVCSEINAIDIYETGKHPDDRG